MEKGEVLMKASELLGFPGAMLSGTKKAAPERRVVWNSNVVSLKYGKIWFGDISITESAEDLQELANALDDTIFVLYEMDGRFENELKPLVENAVEIFEQINED